VSDIHRWMRTLGVVVLVALWALAVPSARASQTQPTVTMTTVPALAGVTFHIGDRPAVTGEDGTAEVAVAPGTYTLTAPGRDLLGTDVRIAFEGWADGEDVPARSIEVDGAMTFKAGFDVDYLIDEAYLDSSGHQLASERVSSVTVSDDAGTTHRWPGPSPGVAGPTAVTWERHPPGTRWLRAIDVSLTDEGLAASKRTYQLRSLTVDGRTVTPATRALPLAPGARWALEVRSPAWWSTPWAWAGALIAAALLAAAALLLRPRLRYRRPQPAPASSPADDRRPEEFVRVVLRNGRTVEGWRTSSADSSAQAIMLEVNAVYSDGEPVPSTPLDSFLLQSQIEHYETLDPSGAAPPQTTAKRVNPPVSS
jgi:hypothetical protein